MYPTLIEDSNGNQIKITYEMAANGLGQLQFRIAMIEDVPRPIRRVSTLSISLRTIRILPAAPDFDHQLHRHWRKL